MIFTGFGGHALELISILKRMGHYERNMALFYVTKKKYVITTNDFNIRYEISDVIKHLQEDNLFALATGNPKLRSYFYKILNELNASPQSIISDKSEISSLNVRLGKALNIMDYSYIGPETNINDGVLVNTHASVHHNCQIGRFVEIAPGARVLGNVYIGEKSFIGANATILPNLEIGREVIIGAGAVVTKSVPDKMKLKGIPAK